MCEEKKKEAVVVDWNQVRRDIAQLLEKEDYDDGSYGPLFARLAWHASGTYDKGSHTGGSNGATMRFGPESTDSANAGLDLARRLLEPVKAKYPSVSYADLWTLSGVVAIEEMAGPKIPWRPGRVDIAVVDAANKVPPNGRLPDAAQGHAHVRHVFYRMGFNDQEIVALLGAHSLGRCHGDRSGYVGLWTRSPTTFSNEFFRLLLEDKWADVVVPKTGKKQLQNPSKDLMMLPSDMALVRDPEFMKYVQVYAKDKERFFKDFAAAFGKLLELGVTFESKPAPAASAPVEAAKPQEKLSWRKRIFG